MGKTRSMIRKIKHDEASNTNRIKTCDNRGVALWSDLNNDMLSLVMMQLGVIDFLAFSGVCKSWRSYALCNRDKVMASKTPMSISISTDANVKACYLEDFEGRKFKTTLRDSADRTCMGVTCGYLILLGEKTKDIWLVNLITRHELYFPDVPVNFFCCPRNIKGVLVFSPSLSGWVLVVFNFCTSYKIWFSIVGKRDWTEVSTHYFINDLHAFKGKIYILHSDSSPDEVRICEMRLHQKPKLVLLETGSFQRLRFMRPWFVNSHENLYMMMDGVSEHPYTNLYELDFGELKWMSREKTADKYAFFCNEFEYACRIIPNATIILQESLADLCSQYGRNVLTDKYGKGGRFHANLWYFFHDCLNVNLIHR